MNPVTAVQVAATAFSVAKGAYEVGEVLCTFVHDVKNLESTTSAFAAEIKALGAACRVVSDRLQDIVKDHERQNTRESSSKDDSSYLWLCLEGQIADCQKTISQLQEAVYCLKRDSSKETNFVSQVVRQIKLNMRTKDIANARNRIRSHTASLQVVLQSIAIEVACVAPQRTDQRLRTHLVELLERRQRLELLRAERDPEDMQIQKKQEEDVLRASEKIISSGETLSASSVASGSVLGELAPGKKNLIYDWMENANAIDNLAFEPSCAEPIRKSSFSSFHNSQPAFTQENTSLLLSPAAVVKSNRGEEIFDEQFEDGGDLDSKDNFTLDAAQHAIVTGREAFQRQDYSEASTTLGEASRIVRELPLNRQIICDPCEMRYMLGVCAFYLEEPSTAKVALLSIIENTPKAKTQNDARRLQVCEAGHLLSLVYIRLGRIEQARLYCENALQGRRRLLGKMSDASYESLALMARILELSGNTSRSKIVNMMIPEPKREELVGYYKAVVVDARYSSEKEIFPQQEPQPPSSSSPTVKSDSNLDNGFSLTVAQSQEVPVLTASRFSHDRRTGSHQLSREITDGCSINETMKLISHESEMSISGAAVSSLPSDRRRRSFQFNIEETNKLVPIESDTLIPRRKLSSLLLAGSRSNLRIAIIAADDLYKPETFHLPDVFACMSVDGEQIKCTNVISNTLKPCWNESFDVQADEESILKVAVFDRRTYKKQGSLGSVKFKIRAVIDSGIGSDETFAVDLDKENHFGLPIEGKVKLQLAADILRRIES
ncbi:MAG: hypothetical protein M1821_007972 [Bathelium mastoideum]|nr:MAG: hypothetical protein M1821_007972 [Bathelium mastoideum]